MFCSFVVDLPVSYCLAKLIVSAAEVNCCYFRQKYIKFIDLYYFDSVHDAIELRLIQAIRQV